MQGPGYPTPAVPKLGLSDAEIARQLQAQFDAEAAQDRRTVRPGGDLVLRTLFEVSKMLEGVFTAFIV